MAQEDSLIAAPFAAGTLWSRVVATTVSAQQSGALVSIPTHGEWLTDGDFRFAVRIVENLARKAAAQVAAQAVSGTGAPRPRNPFLPYDAALYVADVTPTHVCLLNKFNVVSHHVLLVTRQFERQESALGHADFVALNRCFSEFESLAFYNGGRTAGASQPHKHLQLAPLPMSPEGPAFPLEPWFTAAAGPHGPNRVAALPIRHAIRARTPATSIEQAAEQDLALYAQLLAELELERPIYVDGEMPPYNLLMTRDWMFVVPRREECFEGISLNSLAFAGGLLVKDETQLELLRRFGPLAAIRHVGFPLA